MIKDLSPEEQAEMRDFAMKSSIDKADDLSPEEKEEMRQAAERHSLKSGSQRLADSWKNFPKYLQGVLGGTLENLQGVDLYKNKLQGLIGIGDLNKNNAATAQAYNYLINKVMPSSIAQNPATQRGVTIGKVFSPMALPAGPEVEAGAGIMGVLPKLSAFLKNFGVNLGINEALAPAFYPDKSLKDAYKAGLAPSAIGAALPGIAASGKNIVGGLLKQGGTATKEEFERNLAAAKETNVNLPIGQAAASPIAASTQSLLAKIPGAGSAQDFIKSGRILKDETKQTLDSLSSLPDVDEKDRTPLQTISDYINKKALRLRSMSSKNHEQMTDRATELGEAISDRSNIQKVADDRLKQISQLKTVNPNRKIDSTLLGDLMDAKEGNALPFNLAGPERKRYEDLAEVAFKNGDSYMGGIYKDLMKAHQQDVQTNLERINDPKLQNLMTKAKQFHAKAIGPILDNPALGKYASGHGNPDLLAQTFIKTGAYDQPGSAKAIMNFLPPKYQKQLLHEVLTQKDQVGYQGQLVTREDKSLHTVRTMGPTTKDILFQSAPKERNKLEAIAHTRDLFKTDLDQMSNPKTGEQGAKQLWMKIAALSALGGAGAYGYAENKLTPEDALLAALGLRGTSAYMRSPVATSLYRAGLKVKGSPTKLRNTAGLQALKDEDNQ